MRRRGLILSWALLALTAAILVPSLARPGDLPCHRDLLDFFVPMKVSFARAVGSGFLPWWDPWTLGGHPFFANLQSQVLHPPNWIFAVLPMPWAFSVFLAVNFALAGLGAHALARALERSGPASVLAGIAYMAGGFVASLQDLSNQHCAMAWMPWAAAAAVRFAKRPSRVSLAAWAAALAMQFLAGEPQLAVIGGLFSLALALSAARERGRATAAAGAILAAALAITACLVQVVPFAELVLLSDRQAGAIVDPAQDHALTGQALGAMVSAPSGPFTAPAGPYVRSLYLGPAVLLLAGIGALRRGAWRVLAVVAVAGALLAAAPSVPGLGAALHEATPWLRYPIKYFSATALALPLLAAAGLDLAAEAAQRLGARRVARVAGAIVALVAVDLASAHRSLHLSLPSDQLLAPTAAIRVAAAQTSADGPRVHCTPITTERLRARAERLAAGDVLGAHREKVELLEGALPALFDVHATTGGAALTERRQAELLAAADESGSPAALVPLHAGFVLTDALRTLPAPYTAIGVDGGAARLHVIAGAGPFPTRQWQGPNRAVGDPSLPAPSSYPGWTEGPPGTWTFRPRGLVATGLVSAATWLLLGGLVLTGRRRARDTAGSR